MKTRAIKLLTISVSALTLLATPATVEAQATAPVHAEVEIQKADTSFQQTAKLLIESMEELSKTATKLTEAAAKLMETQEKLTNKPTGYRYPSELTAVENVIPSGVSETSEGSPQVYISDEVSLPKESDVYVWKLPTEHPGGGEYVWIPDAYGQAVSDVINGKMTMVSPGVISDKVTDLTEKTFWRGDSIYLAIPTKRLGRFDRKLYNWLIYPKGLWHLSLSANYGELSTEDSEFLSLIQDVDMKGKIYSIKPSVSYFFKSNVCAGLRLAFTKGDMAINSFKVDIDDDMSFDLHDIGYTSDAYSVAAFIQQYFGLSRKGRFAVFNEAEVAVGTGNSHFIRPFDGQIRDTRTKTQTFSINYSPGLSVMMMKNAAFNLSFGIFGFHLKNEKQWENGEEAGSRFTSGINFRFNIFNINFGVSIII